MANELSRKIGSMDCVACGEVIPVKLNGRDTLNISCPWCGLSAYAKGGSEAHGLVKSWVRNGSANEPQAGAGGAPPAAPELPPAPPPAPAKPKKPAVMPWEL